MLLVEDELLLGSLSLRCLESRSGIEAAWAEDGEKGLELAWSWEPDVILLDLILPGISGVELLRRYRSWGGTAKVIAMTGLDPKRIQETVFALGVDLVLQKPVHWEELFELIRLHGGGLKRVCRDLLLEMGAKEGHKGFSQAVECAAMLGEGKCTLLKEAYIEVASRQGTGPGCVAKNVERLAKDLHEAGTPLYYRLTGRNAEDPSLTAREFLDLLSQAARIPL